MKIKIYPPASTKAVTLLYYLKLCKRCTSVHKSLKKI